MNKNVCNFPKNKQEHSAPRRAKQECINLISKKYKQVEKL